MHTLHPSSHNLSRTESSGGGKLSLVSQAVQQHIASLGEVVANNKSKLDMQPAIRFVETHIGEYKRGIQSFMDNEPTPEQLEFVNGVAIDNFSDEVDIKLQLSPDECKNILARIPSVLQELSQIQSVNYDYHGAGYRIYTPVYHPNGDFARKAEQVKPADFPRMQDGSYDTYGWIKENDIWYLKVEGKRIQEDSDHPGRLLVGISDGANIYPSALPASLGSPEAIKAYQTGVFLHEFLHTIDYPNRDPAKRQAIKLIDINGQEFTFQDWWQEWEDLLLGDLKVEPVSFYASTYQHLLNQEQKEKNPSEFTSAVAEQIAESFSGYFLGIQSNRDGLVNFQAAYPKQWGLINKLCSAKLAQ